MAKKKHRAETVRFDNPLRPRNPFALSPLMHRGGAHEKSQGAIRRAARVALKRGDFEND